MTHFINWPIIYAAIFRDINILMFGWPPRMASDVTPLATFSNFNKWNIPTAKTNTSYMSGHIWSLYWHISSVVFLGGGWRFHICKFLNFIKYMTSGTIAEHFIHFTMCFMVMLFKNLYLFNSPHQLHMASRPWWHSKISRNNMSTAITNTRDVLPMC